MTQDAPWPLLACPGLSWASLGPFLASPGSNFDPQITKTHPQIIGTCYFWKKKAPARKPAHRRPNLGQKLIFPKVEFGINEPSGFEATGLLTPPAPSI